MNIIGDREKMVRDYSRQMIYNGMAWGLLVGMGGSFLWFLFGYSGAAVMFFSIIFLHEKMANRDLKHFGKFWDRLWKVDVDD